MEKTPKMSRFVLGFTKLTGILPAYILFKPKVFTVSKKAKRRLPKKAILMSNHTSLLDFVLFLVVFFTRSIHFLIAEVLFSKNKLLSWFLYKIGGIFVNRNSGDFSFIEDSLDVLNKNGVAGVFPQGRLPINGQQFPYKPGIVLIALKTDAPILPVYTDGNYGIFKRAHIMIGEEIHIKDYLDSSEITDEKIKELTKILEEKNFALKEELEKRLKKNNERK